jgi:hypothetical protein
MTHFDLDVRQGQQSPGSVVDQLEHKYSSTKKRLIDSLNFSALLRRNFVSNRSITFNFHRN